MPRQAYEGFVQFEFHGRPVAIYRRVCGSGRPMLLLHGILQSGDIWEPIAQRLAGSFEVLSLDLPGHGSSPPLQRGLASIDLFGDLFQELMRTVKSPEPVVLVGDSLGALIILNLLSKEERWPATIVLVGCPATGLQTPVCALGVRGLVSSSLRLLRCAPRPLAASLVRAGLHLTFHDVRAAGPSVFRGVLDAHPATVERILRQLCAGQGTPDASRVRERHPMARFLVIRGEHDRVVSRDTASSLASSLGADLVEIEDAGHTPTVENPDAVLEAILAFAECLRPLKVLV